MAYNPYTGRWEMDGAQQVQMQPMPRAQVHRQHGGKDHCAVPDIPGADGRGKGSDTAARAAEADHGRPTEHGRENRGIGGKTQCKIRSWH